MDDGKIGSNVVDNLDIKCKKHVMRRCRLPRRQTVQLRQLCIKEEKNASIKKVSVILQKAETDRTSEEAQLLLQCTEAVEKVQSRWRRRDETKRRLLEFEESAEVLHEKCLTLAQAIAQSQHLVVYTGAGISTAAKIPDYRGPNGIWTRLQQGKKIDKHDFSLSEPTYTHMALFELYRKKILKYVVSQNCDGLHLRSGLPRTALSELHGNMYIEVCKNCKPNKEYWRLFDVTENTARYSHKTLRKCYVCNEPLIDTIVHFGERGKLQWPLNWSGACINAEKATTIVCLGSSLKVLKKYPWLWQMDKPIKKRPNLYIVNLQWTPKDEVASVKIHAKCDKVMEIIMNILEIQVPPYDKSIDPIFSHCSWLSELELHTTRQPSLINAMNVKVGIDFPKGKNNSIKDYLNKSDNDLSASNLLNSEVCDNNSNGNRSTLLSNSLSDINNISLPNKEARYNAFSIHELLNASVEHNSTCSNNVNFWSTQDTNNSLVNNYFFTPTLTLLDYSSFAANLLHYQFLGNYSDVIYYPYQTSLLYPGLHSIINPNPDLNIDSLSSITIGQVKDETSSFLSCRFCNINYSSLACLFYPRMESVFINQQYRYSRFEQKNKPNVCVCCDYSTDEEDADLPDNKERNLQTNKDLGNNKIQAGWFGKGYKKNRRLKKK